MAAYYIFEWIVYAFIIFTCIVTILIFAIFLIWRPIAIAFGWYNPFPDFGEDGDGSASDGGSDGGD